LAVYNLAVFFDEPNFLPTQAAFPYLEGSEGKTHFYQTACFETEGNSRRLNNRKSVETFA